MGAASGKSPPCGSDFCKKCRGSIVSEPKDLTKLFESHRNHLRGVAYRMLGSASEADDAVQEAWLRLNNSNTNEVANFGGWLTTVVARICLDMLRSRRSRREEALDAELAEAIADRRDRKSTR